MELINKNAPESIEPLGCGCGCSSCLCWFCPVINYATDQTENYWTGYTTAESQVHN